MLIVGRFINGFCVGICSAQVPVYVGELAPPHLRGLVMGAQQWAITWGVLIMFYISYGSSFLTGPLAFRLPWGLQMIPAIFLFFGLLFTPESPRWLAKKDRWEECCHIISSIHSNNNLDDEFIQMEIQQLKDACELERHKTDNTYFDLFRPHMIWRTHIVVFVQIWCQLTGINAILYCTPHPVQHGESLADIFRHYIYLWNGRPQWQFQPSGFIHQLCDQCGYDRTRASLHGSDRASSITYRR